jgi:hypothetical protein
VLWASRLLLSLTDVFQFAVTHLGREGGGDATLHTVMTAFVYELAEYAEIGVLGQV